MSIDDFSDIPVWKHVYDPHHTFGFPTQENFNRPIIENLNESELEEDEFINIEIIDPREFLNHEEVKYQLESCSQQSSNQQFEENKKYQMTSGTSKNQSQGYGDKENQMNNYAHEVDFNDYNTFTYQPTYFLPVQTRPIPKLESRKRPASAQGYFDMELKPKKSKNERTPRNNKKEVEMNGSNIQRPPFSYFKLAMLAIVNSPKKSITTLELYSFILHHFPYYRFINQNSWKSAVRHSLSDKKIFEKRVDRYFSKSDLMTEWKPKEEEYIEKDPRGKDFYSKLQSGHIGIPRQLFYTSVAFAYPQFAGPKNSVLFYRLLSLGINPKETKIHFLIFKSECTPMFEVDQISTFDEGFEVNKHQDQKEWIQENNDRFAENLPQYYERQNKLKLSNYDENWTTPLMETVINPNDISLY